MKFLIIFILSQSIVYAKSKELPKIVRCLAQEEAKFHQKKYTGPMYKLNQQLVNMLAIETQLIFKRDFTEKVCLADSKALTLHSHLLLDYSEIFITPRNKNDWEINLFAKQVDLLISKNYELFLYLVSLVQMEISSPHCLSKLVPNYETYLEKEMYLKDLKSNYNDKDSLLVIEKILEHFTDIELFKQKCIKISKALNNR